MGKEIIPIESSIAPFHTTEERLIFGLRYGLRPPQYYFTTANTALHGEQGSTRLMRLQTLFEAGCVAKQQSGIESRQDKISTELRLLSALKVEAATTARRIPRRQ